MYTSFGIKDEIVNLSIKEKIDMFVMEAIRDAKSQKMNPKEEYQNFDTILTGCNDKEIIDIPFYLRLLT